MGVIYNNQNVLNNNFPRIDNYLPRENYLHKDNKSKIKRGNVVSRKKQFKEITSENIQFLESLGLRIKKHV